MSSYVFPTLPGLTWDIQKAPEFATAVQRAVNLSELRASYTDAPVWHFRLTYDVLRDDTLNDELNALGAFFLAHLGSWDSWLYASNDATVSAMQFGTGDGNTTAFQLTRSVASAVVANTPTFNEPVANANISALTVNNTPTSNYSIAANGVVTFNAAPSANAVLRWSGTLYYRCRFKDDSLQFTQFMRTLWEAKSVEFVGSLGTAI